MLECILLASPDSPASLVFNSTHTSLLSVPTPRVPPCLQSIALDPRYASRKTKEFVAAIGEGGTVQMCSQGWLGRSDVTLQETGARVVRWSDSLVAWGSDRSVSVSQRQQPSCELTILPHCLLTQRSCMTSSQAPLNNNVAGSCGSVKICPLSCLHRCTTPIHISKLGH